MVRGRGGGGTHGRWGQTEREGGGAQNKMCAERRGHRGEVGVAPEWLVLGLGKGF
jgi:hypothetical protein